MEMVGGLNGSYKLAPVIGKWQENQAELISLMENGHLRIYEKINESQNNWTWQKLHNYQLLRMDTFVLNLPFIQLLFIDICKTLLTYPVRFLC